MDCNFLSDLGTILRNYFYNLPLLTYRGNATRKCFHAVGQTTSASSTSLTYSAHLEKLRLHTLLEYCVAC